MLPRGRNMVPAGIVVCIGSFSCSDILLTQIYGKKAGEASVWAKKYRR